MDESRLASADAAYAAGDWTTAAREYLAATGGKNEGSGYAFHRAGNALMRLKRLDDACAVYERALQDPLYGEAAAVACNYGTARASLGVFDEAARLFEMAAADPGYEGRYKALQGAAGALYEMGRIEDAAESYRRAALEAANPDPGKALNNLGLCFMKMGRPEDAVGAYRAAVEIEGYKGRGRAAANLGMAYAALEMHDLAVASFERARDELGFELKGALESAYRASRAKVPERERIEGWETGEMAPVPAGSGVTGPMLVPDDEDDSTFFTITEAEMRSADRETRLRERRETHAERPVWLTVVVWAAVAVVVAGIVVAGYLFGLGYPTQQMTVNGMLEAYGAGEAVDAYWVAVPAPDVDKAMSTLPPAWTSYEIVGVVRSARTSKVDLEMVLEQGGTVAYEVSLAREGVGWKVNGVTNSFNSLDGGM